MAANTDELLTELLRLTRSTESVSDEAVTTSSISAKRLVKKIRAGQLDLSSTTPDGKNILHLAVSADLKILLAVLNHPDFNRELLSQRDQNGNTAFDILAGLAEPEDVKFIKKQLLNVSGCGIYFPDYLSIGQFNINKKIYRRLQMKNRDASFFNDGGLCNGYSFLHNYYVETNGEDYFFSTLFLMNLWDESKESLKKVIPDFLPQSKYYKTYDQLFEQWTNDLFLTFASNEIQTFIPTMNQYARHFQYEIIKPYNQDKKTVQTTTYNHNYERYSMCDIHYLSNPSVWDLNKSIARSKARFVPAFVCYSVEGKLRVKAYDLDGKETEFFATELDFFKEGSQFYNFDKHDIKFIVESWIELNVIKGEAKEKKFVTKDRMLEFLNYLSRLPEGLYVDVSKTNHSTTFRKLNNGNILFYDCNDQYKVAEIADYQALNDQILVKNGHKDYEYYKEKYPTCMSIYYNYESTNSFIPHVYHFNSDQALQNLRDFRVFDEKDLPRSTEEAQCFQQASPNQFTHLHVAVITRDLASIVRLVDDGYTPINARDFYDRTPLDIAVTNGFMEAALIILNKSPDPLQVDADYMGKAFSIGQYDGIYDVLIHPKLKVNMMKVAAAAMQNHCLDVVSWMLDKQLISSDSFIQSALLANDLPLIELLLNNHADIKKEDSQGNTACHYALYMLNPVCCRYLLRHSAIDFEKKNNNGLTVMDILAGQISRKNVSSEDREAMTGITRLFLEEFSFDLNNKAQKKMLSRLLHAGISLGDDALFNLALDKINRRPDVLNQYITHDGMKMTALHLALTQNRQDMADALVEAGANTGLVIRNGSSSFSTNPLAGKSATDLMTNPAYPSLNPQG